MPTPATVPIPRTLYVAAALIGGEAVAAIGYGVLEATHIHANRLVLGVGTALLLLGYGAFLAAIARGVARARRWSRGAGVATQLMQVLLAWSFRPSPTTWVAVLLGGIAVAVLGGLLTPAATTAFDDDDPGDDQ